MNGIVGQARVGDMALNALHGQSCAERAAPGVDAREVDALIAKVERQQKRAPK